MAPASGRDGTQIAQVIPLTGVRRLGDRRFDYLVPPDLEKRVAAGSVVVVPFGHRTVWAVVLGLERGEEAGSLELRPLELRPILSVAEERIPESLLLLAQSVSERYLASLASCLRLVLPPLGPPRSAAGRMRHAWAIPVGLPGGGGSAGSGPQETQESCASRLTQKQRAVLAALPPEGKPVSSLCRELGVSPSVVHALARKGLLHLLSQAPVRQFMEMELAPPQGGPAAPSNAWPRLWPEQEEAVEKLIAAYERPGLAHELLWGVTGSGKTEVYLRVIAHALAQGAGAILLVPEIALTPQMIQRVRSRFGSLVGVLHSGLPRGERLREYRRIACGQARVVVGARSAVFAPVVNLRLIILDESHDSSYKQEEEPRYHARTVAKLRLTQLGGGLLLEGTATPAAESLVYAGEPLRLRQRAAGAEPYWEIVDMRVQGGAKVLAPISREALAQVIREGEQAIVLLNRRGYAGRTYCELCGHVLTCASCELSLTYHSRERRLVCHRCGRTYPQPPLCPACGQGPLTRSIPGTERLDRELRALAPADRVFRMDSDVLTSGARVRRVLESFGSSFPGVLVGTQMVAKGHDFPGVTLVLVADADTGLYVPDFRAAERTFQLLTQAAGRAGRAERPGRVLVQTWNPDVPCIKMALEGRVSDFYRLELETRRRLGYPPFVHLIRIVSAGPDGARVEAGARYLRERLAPYFPAQELRGPVRLPLLRSQTRWQVLIGAQDGERARAIVGKVVAALAEPYRQRGVGLVVDVDPESFL